MHVLDEKIDQLAEMTRDEQKFLIKLIKENKPQKLVEVGVAAGGTGVKILSALSENDNNSEMYSIDLEKLYYRDKKKKTGYLINDFLQENEVNVKHYFKLGKYLPEFLEEIGGGIDFLILDTVHCAPGEIFDFLAIFPFLAPNAIVVFHDIILNHLSDNNNAYVTQMLINCLAGEILTPIELNTEYPNIGVLRVNPDTLKYIDNVFNMLTVSWYYMPSTKEIGIYRAWYERFYNKMQLYVFDEAVRLNSITYKKNKRAPIEDFIKLYRFIMKYKEKKVFIYGYGQIGKRIGSMFIECGIDVEKYIVTSMSNMEEEVISIDEYIERDEKHIILVAVNKNNQIEIVNELDRRNITNYILLEDHIINIIENDISMSCI